MTALPARVVTLVLCLPDGSVLGTLPPFEVALPWWQEVGPVVEAASAATGGPVTVLRLLAASGSDGCGGAVTYLAEVPQRPSTPLGAWTRPMPDEPLRLPYARPGGPAADLAWADAALAATGRDRTGPARQVRTWNLSSLWRLPTDDGAAWLKVVPPFFAHEGAVIARLDSAVVPTLLAVEGPRALLDELPGDDLYEATGPMLLRMVSLLVELQVAWTTRLPDLLALGLPDWRAEPFAQRAADVLRRTADRLDAGTRQRCERVVDGLPQRFDDLAGCGVPDTLVHGDFHTGNLFGDATSLRLLDWGDCGVGHPLLDRAAFVPRVPASELDAVLAHWDDLWRTAVPGCDPVRATELVAPVACLRQAMVYDGFVRRIEPDERVYHRDDSVRWLRALGALPSSRP